MDATQPPTSSPDSGGGRPVPRCLCVSSKLQAESLEVAGGKDQGVQPASAPWAACVPGYRTVLRALPSGSLAGSPLLLLVCVGPKILAHSRWKDSLSQGVSSGTESPFCSEFPNRVSNSSYNAATSRHHHPALLPRHVDGGCLKLYVTLWPVWAVFPLDPHPRAGVTANGGTAVMCGRQGQGAEDCPRTSHVHCPDLSYRLTMAGSWTQPILIMPEASL